ncbi:MAG: MogA/MoaB family molybdenum cofactor biosynthesis protein [Promethearchaeota archaeon]
MITHPKQSDPTKSNHLPIPVQVKVFMMSDSLSQLSEKKRAKLDTSGEIAHQFCLTQKYEWLGIDYLPDEINDLQAVIRQNLTQKINLLITIGGTGIAKRDITIEAIRPLLDKELPGFGELFRAKTYQEVGSVSMMTRTLAGISQHSLIVCLPGSPNAVKLGLKLITQEIEHILNHI